MRINKSLFPLILLVIFIDTIALGMALGYWKTKGGGRHRDFGNLSPPGSFSASCTPPTWWCWRRPWLPPC
jgi:hypothetical protein